MAPQRAGHRRDDPDYNSEDGIARGNQIAGLALANAQRWGVIHVIWRQGFYPGIGAPSWTADYGVENAGTIRPRPHRDRWGRLPPAATPTTSVR